MKLSYRHFGNGKPVIILHGLFGQSDNWVTIARRIADKFSVYIPDQRNHGQSPHSPVLNYIALSDDLFEFMEEHGIGKTILIGHSMGGKAAMTFALEHPELVEKLVVIDISPGKYPERNIHTQVITLMLSLDLDSISSRTQAEKILLERYPDERIRMFILKNLYYKQPGKLAWKLNIEAINQNLGQLFEGIFSESQYTGPCLFVRGGNSDYISEKDSELIKSLFPNAVTEIISGASHWVHADAPEELCHVLSFFLEKECSFKD
jgi:esterase